MFFIVNKFIGSTLVILNEVLKMERRYSRMMQWRISTIIPAFQYSIWLRGCNDITRPFTLVLFDFHFVIKPLDKLWLFAGFMPREKQK